MLFDVRTYTCVPGGVPKAMKLYEEMGMAPQTRHLGQPYFYGIVETGLVNSYMHIWFYESAADREARRKAMLADPEWQAYLKKSQEMGWLIRQENQLMTAAPFFTPLSS
ncbi:MAG: NIPSNAP family protein [Alphaproteobacteria bacterium]|nr:NIPSNAP family protein [Alphaproteobacteria bacterium]